MKTGVALAGLFLAFLAPFAETAASPSRPTPFHRLGSHMVESLVGWPTAAHGLAVASTWGLLESGADAAVYRSARDMDAFLNGVLFYPPLLAGTIAPLLLPAGLYWLPDDPGLAGAGAAGMQAAGIAFLYKNILKAVTGRLPPESDHPDPESQAHGFRFGFLRGGLFNGWPSGHMMVNSSLAASLAAYRPELAWLRWSALAYAASVGAAVTWGARGDIHWISDTVAGGLMGGAIGWTVGSGFRNSAAGSAARATGFSLHPVAGDRWGMLARFQLR
jgi:membrane-associated phospholipid phosphatase